MSLRKGGRAHRRANQTSRLGLQSEPVHGGAYLPLSNREIELIHDRALAILAEVGMRNSVSELTDLAIAAGCIDDGNGRLKFPRHLVEDIIQQIPKRATIYGRAPGRDVEVGAGVTHYSTGGLAVQMVDIETGDYRPSTLRDLYDCARLVDNLPNIHFFNRTCVPNEIEDLRTYDLAIAHACATGTTKPIAIGFNDPSHVDDCVWIFDQILGGEGRFRDRPFAICNSCAVVPPLTFGADNTKVAMKAARAGFPVNMINAAQSGATAPAALAGTLVQSVAETLAGMAMVQLSAPGAVVLWANWPFVSDLRTGAFSGGGGEIAVMNAASAQIARWYGFPNSVSGGMTDAKEIDAQYGYEKGMTNLAAGLAGADIIFLSVGMVASIMGCALESYVTDDELLAAARQIIKGIDVNDETLSVEVIRDVCLSGPGHFLAHEQTLELMNAAFVYPELACRRPPDQWEEMGRPSLREKARERVREILTRAKPHVAAELEAFIASEMPIVVFQAE